MLAREGWVLREMQRSVTFLRRGRDNSALICPRLPVTKSSTVGPSTDFIDSIIIYRLAVEGTMYNI